MRRIVLLALAAALNAMPAVAQDFYRGKTVTILAGFSPGGGFDLNARVLARHIGRHIPGNPTVVVQNMAGAGSLTAVHYLDLSAAKDGTVLNISTSAISAIPVFTPTRSRSISASSTGSAASART
jgi:tripartite-type tricarboxylate transporter receptor subunit TctC